MAPLAFDARLMLAMNIATQPGVYALMLGSGVSTSAGMPTGWGVVERLVQMVAASSGAAIEGDDWEGWWARHYPDAPLGYSSLLEALGPTSASRKALLAQFFEPSPEDREEGSRPISDAHRAIARLVAGGYIRVILTTNFDRLIEHALDAEGVVYQVVSSDDAVLGMEPLPHARVTLIKLHGDYTSLDQRNTSGELAEYPAQTVQLLNRIFEEYGLVISGWSGEWDQALLNALEGRVNRRYPLVWTAWSTGGSIAQRLTSSRGDALIENAGADDLFSDLVRRVEALEDMAEPSLSIDLKVARLRKCLPNPIRHLEVRALLEDEIEALARWSADRPTSVENMTHIMMRNEVTSIRQRCEALLALFSQGIALDRDRQHDDLWVWVLQKVLEIRPSSRSGSIQRHWETLSHLPAFFLLRVGVMAALSTGDERLILRLCSEPKWSSILLSSGMELPADQVLHVHNVLDSQVWKVILQSIERQRYIWPASHLTRVELRSFAEAISGVDQAERALNRMEYRLALANFIFRPSGTRVYYHPAAGGEFLVSEEYRSSESGLTAFSDDFLKAGDVEAWVYAAEGDVPSAVARLDERLRVLVEAHD